MRDDLARVARQWDAHGRADARWAVLSDNSKRGGRWDDASFYATGRTLVASTLDIVAASGAMPGRRARALDFGCGVGRLSRALAERFERVDGVDVAASMVAEAQAGNPAPERIAFHVNQQSDLQLFPSDSFDLVFSFITLQHIPTALALGYVREFVRVTAPGGTVVFQAPYRADHPGWKHYVDVKLPRLTMLYRRIRYGAATRNDVFTHDAAAVADTLTDSGAVIARVQSARADDCPGWSSALYVARKRA